MKRYIKPGGQPAANRALACAHHPDQRNSASECAHCLRARRPFFASGQHNHLYIRHTAPAKRAVALDRCEMGWGARITIGVLVLLFLAAGALAIYAGTLSPPHRTYQQV